MITPKEWLDYLHRGGNCAHFWCSTPTSTSTWFDCRQPQDRRRAWLEAAAVNAEQYVSINPSTRIPPTNASGSTDPKRIAKQIAYVQCLNVLHSEYDGKDWVTEEDYRPFLLPGFITMSDTQKRQAIRKAKEAAFYPSHRKYKAEAFGHVCGLPIAPTLIVDSGGGYHCYWFLDAPINITDSNRQSVIDVQHWWVLMNGGDEGVSDITRVYRVLGTKNMKPGWAGNNPTVTPIEYNANAIYDYEDLAETAREWRARTMPKQDGGGRGGVALSPAPAGMGTVRERYNSSVDLVALLESYDYRVKYRAGRVARLVRPGGEAPSLTVFPSEGTRPAVAVAHNTGDALYREGGGHDAYSIMMLLEFNGDWKAAFVAAKKAVGMWEETTIDKARNHQREKRGQSTVAPWMVAA